MYGKKRKMMKKIIEGQKNLSGAFVSVCLCRAAVEAAGLNKLLTAQIGGGIAQIADSEASESAVLAYTIKYNNSNAEFISCGGEDDASQASSSPPQPGSAFFIAVKTLVRGKRNFNRQIHSSDNIRTRRNISIRGDPPEEARRFV